MHPRVDIIKPTTSGALQDSGDLLRAVLSGILETYYERCFNLLLRFEIFEIAERSVRGPDLSNRLGLFLKQRRPPSTTV